MPSLEKQIEDGFEGIKKEFEDYKKENDARLEKVEKGRGTADFDEKLSKFDEALEKQEKRIEEMQTALNRPQNGGDKKEAEELKAEKKAAYEKFMRKGEMALTPEETKALSSSSDPDGGYYVRDEHASEISKRVFESSKMRQLSSVQQISSRSLKIPVDWDEAASGWVGEQASRPETDTPQVQEVEVVAHELYALPKASQQVLEDAAIDLESWLGDQVAMKIARDESDAFVNGNGVNKPRGILTYDSTTTNEFGKVEQFTAVASGAAALDDADDLIDLQGKLFEAYQGNATWQMKRATSAAIRKLKGTDDNYLWDYATVGTLNERGPILLNKPVFFNDEIPAIGSDALAVVYGDMRMAYQVVDRVGISVLRDPFSAKPFVLFYTRKRVGGAVKNFQAYKILKLKS